MISLSVVICTRNRPDDLKRCLLSISKQNICDKKNIEVVIIDDGLLSDSALREFKTLLSGFNFAYVKKENPGLFLSRIMAVSLAKSDLILFLDDDVEVEENYFDELIKTYAENRGIVAVSGVDLLLNKPNVIVWLYHKIFLLKAYNPGELSITGYGESMQYWNGHQQIFSTEFLSGCNMSFRKEVIAGLQPVDWLDHYSLGEDVYLSYVASLKGEMIINPKLKVKHHQSKAARDKLEEVAFNEIVNHHYLLKIKNEKKSKQILHLWTILGILFKSTVMLDFRKIKGYMKGLKFLFTDLFKNNT